MKKGGLISEIKTQVKKSGSSKGKVLYLKDGGKARVRFLQEMDDGISVLFHDHFDQGVNHVCQEPLGKECPHHDEDEFSKDDGWRHRTQFAWSVYDHDAKEVKLLMGAANNFSPVPQLVAMYETYGTIMDRDYVITKSGSALSQSFQVVPMDKVAFKNKTAKPYSENKMMTLLDKAFPVDEVEGDDEDEDDVPTPKKKKKPAPAKKAPAKKKKPEVEDYDDDEDDEDEEDLLGINEDNDSEYDDMTPKELYIECVEREIKVKKKMPAEYYIEKLEDYDEENDEEDDW